MTARNTELYKKAFIFMRDGLLLAPAMFMSDFEAAARKAAVFVWPRITLSGCYFHYAQAIRRKAKSFPAIAKQFQTGESANMVLKVLFFFLSQR